MRTLAPHIKGTLPLIGVLVCSAILNVSNSGFPLGLHFDEIKKVEFVEEGSQDFCHPLLLLQAAKVVAAATGALTPLEIAVSGRLVSAIAGVAIACGVYVLLNERDDVKEAMIGGMAAALCPILVVHAHYFKEDMVLTACLIWTCVALLHVLAHPSRLRAACMGCLLGLAGSAHYKAILIVPVVLFVVCMERVRRPYREVIAVPHVQRGAAICCVASAIVVWSVVNYPAFLDFGALRYGLSYEWRHSLEGHDGVLLWPGRQWWTYHWRHSVLPGMTWPVACVGLGGLVLAVLRWPFAEPVDRLMAAFVVLYYLVPEASPTKPPPDDCRYVIPVVAGLCYFVGRMSGALVFVPGGAVRTLMALMVVGMLSWSGYVSVRLVCALAHDTRQDAAIHARALDGNVLFMRDATDWPHWTSRYFDLTALQRKGASYVVVSSFHYDRFASAATLPGQSDTVYSQARTFDLLFTYPYVEFRPPYRSYAFSNPVVRIVDVRRSATP
jgi:hypothetical protein